MNERTFERVASGGCFPDPEGVLWLIRKFGISGMGGSDGCYCYHFQNRGISVDVSCHKSEHCVRVHSGYMEFDVSELFEIANEVLSQLPFGGSRYRVRFCDYGMDHVNGRWEGKVWREEYKCGYCGKPRNERDAYRCQKCVAERKGEYLDGHGFQRLVAAEVEP